ncbi:MAG: tyrosine-type recombinase/integrase [Planctomycetes bacterium]|nr:tyrosine-type recombinase/integrase [Planctomycetota bacterium]
MFFVTRPPSHCHSRALEFLAESKQQIPETAIAESRYPSIAMSSRSGAAKRGPLFCSKPGHRLARQNVDAALKASANQANANLPGDKRIHLAAHLLRHTNLRKTANEYGVQYTKEQSGHASDRYIWRYMQPFDQDKGQAHEDLF